MLVPAASSKTILSTLIAAISHPFARTPAQLYVRLSCALIALIVFSAINLQAQESRSEDEVLRVNTDLFVIPIRVKDKRAPVATLSERDLTLEDKDHFIAGLTLYHGADRVALVFALDQSGSVREIVSQQREAALALASRFGDQSQVAVIRFGEKSSLVVPFGKDTAAARDAFSLPAWANEPTAIFDAAGAAVSAFDGLPQLRSERRLIVLISDGLDNASKTRASSVIQAAVANHVSIYVIHLPLFEPRDGRLAVRTPAKGFRDLAEKTGGGYFLVGNKSSALTPLAIDLSTVFRAIEEDLRSQYLLGFYRAESGRDGRDHRFTIGFPAGVEFQIGGLKYSRTQEFFHVVQEKSPK